jgi:hypothetical protein
MPSMQDRSTSKGMRVLGVILIIYAALVATHEGEFWPFSIYPMFSQAGNPWTRAMVIDVSNTDDALIWQIQQPGSLYGEPVPVRKYGVDQIDYSNFMSKTENWTQERMDAVLAMFGSHNLQNRRWMAAKVHGHMIGRDSIAVEVVPWLLMTEDGVRRNPNLQESDYFRNPE